MCYSCHKKEDVISKKNAHPEVAKGSCLVCHKPHASSEEGLLSKKKADICKRLPQTCWREVRRHAHGNYPMALGAIARMPQSAFLGFERHDKGVSPRAVQGEDVRRAI